ncbi:hypothetical protein [Bradyrhizobium roseum]|uniref:hypothetical protein n=1 Tax=Bradyrhizobium roseum TaxID=3056648 RepID=UPI002601AF4F|nr:hypothetical protein [Bradyrhizobium roseus]WKA26366.1 hypothetical protein QUH67_22515 [Bradyrhizobium roseus]
MRWIVAAYLIIVIGVSTQLYGFEKVRLTSALAAGAFWPLGVGLLLGHSLKEWHDKMEASRALVTPGN